MKYPAYDGFISRDWLQSSCIEANDEFECPACKEALRLIEDEGTYNGAIDSYLEVL
ncbi:hypothetical protein ACJJIK_11140 [Microbulbifer sp. ZKSA006]|uniref:hypothetical protein n=1 Tax=Microbulbifer sp. ZKSA006 TaxID=3243390 RepID=UPI00403A4511